MNKGDRGVGNKFEILGIISKELVAGEAIYPSLSVRNGLKTHF